MTRRRAISAFIAIAFGAATTLAIAVTRSLFPAWVTQPPSGYFRSGPYVCAISIHGAFGCVGYDWIVLSKESVSDFASQALADDPRPPPSWSTCWDLAVVERLWNSHPLTSNRYQSQIDQGVGWPFIALHAHKDWAAPGGVRVPWTGAYNLSPRFIPGPPTPKLVERFIPIQPVWAGLIGDIFFFGVAYWLLPAVLVRLRRQLRLRRGVCITCAYNLRGLPPNPPCPECGHARSGV